MTIFQAGEILRQAGEVYHSKGDLMRIFSRTFDPLIKTACEKLITSLNWRNENDFNQQGIKI